ncbi:radical SAM protein [Deferrisoma palaeochoriense]
MIHPEALRSFEPVPPGRAEVTCALVYPNRLALAAANLGFQTLYALLNREGWLCHRAAADRPRTVEADRDLAAYDVVAASLSFEGDYPAFLELLRGARIPLRSRDRKVSHPLILVGGVAPTLNPEPLAPFSDIVFLGEAEAGLAGLLAFLRDHRELPRPERLRALAEARLAGVYVPAHHDPAAGFRAERVWARVPWDPARTRFLVPDDPFGGAYLLEIGRGCPHACRFCAAGYATRPFRPLPLTALLPWVGFGAEKAGKVGFVAAAVSDHPGFTELARAALEAGAGFSVSSFRAENLSAEAADLLARGGLKTLTVALEAGSPRLRTLLGKRITEEDLLRAARLAGEAGIPNLRIYAMVGLPTETDEDVDALADAAERARAALGRGQVTVSAAPFVPKPHTPLQWEPAPAEALVRARIRRLQARCGRVRGVRAVAETPKWSRLQALWSRGGRAVGDLLEQGVGSGDWRAVLRSPLARRELDEPRDPDTPLPWDFLGGVPDRAHLLRERAAALAGMPPIPCRPGTCTACGVCESEGDAAGR